MRAWLALALLLLSSWAFAREGTPVGVHVMCRAAADARAFAASTDETVIPVLRAAVAEQRCLFTGNYYTVLPKAREGEPVTDGSGRVYSVWSAYVLGPQGEAVLVYVVLQETAL